MRDLLRPTLVGLVLLAFGCSDGAPPVVEGDSIVVAERGIGFTNDRRERDAAAGITTAADLPAAATAGTPPTAVDPSTLKVGGVDPSLASRLQADPSAYAANKIEGLVTFRMLSLTGFDIDALLDYLFSDPAELRRRVDLLARDLALGLARSAAGAPIPAAQKGSAVVRVTGSYSAASRTPRRPLDTLRELQRGGRSLARLQNFRFPEPIQALDGKDAAVVGYILPLEFKPKSADEVRVFMLVRDLMACCFGGAPRPDEWIYVEMEGDSSSKMYPYLPVIVRGTLKVGRVDEGEDGFGLTSGVYSMKGREVQEFKAE